jgi:hypothetical protein
VNPRLRRLEHEVRELTARLAPLAAPLGRVELAGKLGLTLDPWQRELLTSAAPQILLNCSRQSGKSTMAALLGLHEIVSAPNRLILIVSPGERQSKLLMKALLRFYRDLGRPVPAAAENILSLELTNGSAVYALPGAEDTIRGFSSVSLLLVDEASRVPDDLMAAVRPMRAVSVDSRLLALSTPFGKRGWWYFAWSEGGADWERYEVPATACPRISPEFLAQERRALPDAFYRSEYECAFVEQDDAFFSEAQIAAAFSADVEPLWALDDMSVA